MAFCICYFMGIPNCFNILYTTWKGPRSGRVHACYKRRRRKIAFYHYFIYLGLGVVEMSFVCRERISNFPTTWHRGTENIQKVAYLNNNEPKVCFIKGAFGIWARGLLGRWARGPLGTLALEPLGYLGSWKIRIIFNMRPNHEKGLLWSCSYPFIVVLSSFRERHAILLLASSLLPKQIVSNIQILLYV
jgi:hypothetical protein